MIVHSMTDMIQCYESNGYKYIEEQHIQKRRRFQPRHVEFQDEIPNFPSFCARCPIYWSSFVDIIVFPRIMDKTIKILKLHHDLIYSYKNWIAMQPYTLKKSFANSLLSRVLTIHNGFWIEKWECKNFLFLIRINLWCGTAHVLYSNYQITQTKCTAFID